METTQTLATQKPATDIVDTGKSLILKVEIPGADADSIHVDFERSTLTVSAETSAPDFEGFELKRQEFSQRNWHRAFEILQPVNAEAIDATFKHGVLEISLPRPEADSRRIQIKEV